ncbi:hypothetical protein AADZ91_12135 [Colwelliaceae bacterium 6441]
MKEQKYWLGLIVFGLLSYANADNVTIYRWVDSNNIVHFSQQQPKHDNYTELSMANAKQPQKENRATSPEKTQPAPKSIPPVLNDKCEAAKTNVKTLTDFDNVQYTDSQGVVQMLSKKEKAQQLEINKKQVEVFCDS